MFHLCNITTYNYRKSNHFPNTSPLPPGVKVPDHLLQVVAVQVGIDLWLLITIVSKEIKYTIR